jgi:L,D-transpeptidase-like protein
MRVPLCTLLTLAGLALLAGCGGSPERGALGVQKTTCIAGSFRPLGSAREAPAAAARAALAAYGRPGGRVVRRFGRLNPNGVPTVFGVVGARVDERCRATWYRVRMPRRPNGSIAWVRARDVTTVVVRTRVVVDLSERRVTLFRGGRKVLATTAAVGAPGTPTPVGTFYVDQRLLASNPAGPYGPGAIGIAAYSDVLTGWAQGGPIAIHGTNRPELIGEAVSNGCVRVRNDALLRLFRATLAGTPVVIQR